MSDYFIGEIRAFSFGFAPKGWAFCNGQTLPINQYQALFSLLGTQFGGNGTTNFLLPNLQGTLPIGVNQIATSIGQRSGQEFHTLTCWRTVPIHRIPQWRPWIRPVAVSRTKTGCRFSS
jgi:microcystin-dependent protein